MLDLSDFQRGQIVGASRAGVSVTQASQLLGVLELESTLLTRTFTAEQQCPSHLSQMLKPNIVNSGVTLTRPGQLISERREPHTFNPYLASFSLGGIFPQLSYPFFLLYGESFYYPPPIDPPCPGLATRNSEVVRRPSNGRNNYRGNYENGRQGNQWFESRNRFQKDDRRLNDRGYQFRNGSQKDDFSRGGYRNRGSSLIINKEGIKTDETKVRAIVVMKPPRNSKDVSKFLEVLLVNRGAEGIPRGQGGHNESASFKRGLKKPFKLFTDASSIGVGAVLNQEQRRVVFASRTLSGAERNYTVTGRECVCGFFGEGALNKFRTYLSSLPIKVITNHTTLTRLTHGKNLSNRMVRWALKLAEFNIEWEHRLGIQNAVANVFSTNPIEIIIGEKVHCAIIRDLVLSLRDQLIEEQRTDPEVISINIWKTQKIAQLMRQYVRIGPEIFV
ncbi:retrovirus-related Pol polyprotein from transposon opus [Trichonephila clavipes]|nr:retrovirus-related Pol polyprotein from transposon opus [Trichonephila clavipes]